MPIVTFLPSKIVVEVEAGTSLFDAAIKAGLPVASSCSADFVCGRCNMQILQGETQLSEQTEAERKLLHREKKNLTDRVSCRTFVLGNCTVKTTYW